MTDHFMKQTLRVAVAQICQTIGWNSAQTTPLEILVDTLHRYLHELTRASQTYADQFGRTRPNLNDLGLAFSRMGINLNELEEYVQFVDPVPSNMLVPKFPVAKESHLNFLKPGSQEVVTRPVHVHEHLPPTITEQEEAESIEQTIIVDSNSPTSHHVFKRPGDPLEMTAVKRARLTLEEEGRPLREISSVMMTTGGFLSPAREGKLPESRVVLPSSRSRSNSPQLTVPSYPTVPPEVNREKKKKLSNERKKEKSKNRHHNHQHHGDAVKKLASMKEMAKLKALKPKAPSSSPLFAVTRPSSNKVQPAPAPVKPASPDPEKSLIQKLSESPHLVVTPVAEKRPSTPDYDRSKESGVTIAKLTNEPDKQKLNIFKKISKVKEEKIDKHEEPPAPKERSPGLVIEEVMPKRSRSALGDLMELMPKDRNQSPISRPRTPDIHTSSPGSPTTPKTPEILRRSPEQPPTTHKKKKKDKEKEKKKKSKTKDKKQEEELERPKTPDMTDLKPTPLFPFFPNFPPAPGLIPPTLTNPLFPRLPLPIGSLPIQPSHFLPHLKTEPVEVKKEKPLSPSFSKSFDDGLSPLSVLLSRDKEKKKEHKKEKKDKVKKKKDKKEKNKTKEKGEKKHKVKEKKEKKKDKVKESTSVPRLTLKLSTNTPTPPASPGIPKAEEVQREPSPEVARISSLFAKPEPAKPPVEAAPKSPGTIIDQDGNKVWICPSCGRPDDGTPMIGCDECDAWYHWVCVGIQVPPDENEDWYCRFCIVKKQGLQHLGKKKRGRKKKPPV